MRITVCLIGLLLLAAGPALSQDGTLDPTFGTGGLVTTDFAGKADLAYAVTIQPDGKLVLAGYALIGARRDFTLARYTTGGVLDPTFGTGGKVVTDFASLDDYGYAIVALSELVVSDGRLLVAGHARAGTSQPDFAVARYTASGALDATFGTGGLVTTDFGGRDDYAYALALQSDGKFLVAGDARTASGNYQFGLARYTANGTLDATFGTGGKTMTDFNGGYDGVGSIIVLPDGKIVAAGRVANGATGNDFGLARYTANGMLDLTFGTNGKVTTDFNGGDDRASEVLRQPDGKLIVVGRAFNGTQYNFGIARYTADGMLDATFGTGGKVLMAVGLVDSRASTLVLQADGKIVVGGVADNNFALVRYLASGALDPTFGSGGIQTTDFAGGADAGTALVMQPDKKLVLAGYATNLGTGFDFALVRYRNGTVVPPLACSDPATEPAYGGGYVLNSEGTRAFVKVDVPQGATRAEFYNTSNLAIGNPETSAESRLPVAYDSRVGDTFVFSSAPTALYFPITTLGGSTKVAFFLRVTDACKREVDVDPSFTLTNFDAEMLAGFTLGGAQPNPVGALTTIPFSVAEATEIHLGVYDVLGREVAVLADGAVQAGAHTVRFDSRALPAGVYLYRLTARGQTRVGMLTVAR